MPCDLWKDVQRKQTLNAVAREYQVSSVQSRLKALSEHQVPLLPGRLRSYSRDGWLALYSKL
jgi:hypothetical protein